MASRCLSILLLLPLLLIASCRDGVSPEAQREILQSASQAHPGGHGLYLEHCSSCHGLEARGGVGPRLLANGRMGDEAYVEGIIKRGRRGRGMPPFEYALSDEEIAALTGFVASLGDEGD
jgi:mono/diheme cytochrome c family protein